MRITGWSARKLLSLTVGDAVRLASTQKGERNCSGEIAGVLLIYLRDIRQHLVGEDSGDALFIGWRRAGIGTKNWNVRIGRTRLHFGQESQADIGLYQV
jgi:hypothetical protein